MVSHGSDLMMLLQLGYVRLLKTTNEHIPYFYTSALDKLMSAAGSTETVLPDQNKNMSMIISERTPYKLRLRSRAKPLEPSSYCVCFEVLPSIRKHDAYMTNDMAMTQWHHYENSKEDAMRLIRNHIGYTCVARSCRKHRSQTYIDMLK